MGTNYYLQPKATAEELKTLSRLGAKLPRLHIGKSSGGWTFSFHSPDVWDIEDFGITTGPIKSWETWKTALSLPVYQIVDEYGEYKSFEDFEELVKAKKDSKFNHTTYCINSDRDSEREHARRSCYLDEEGNSFQYGDFS